MTRATAPPKAKTPKAKHEPRSAGAPEIEMGKKIRLRRVEVGLSQSELAGRLGVSFQQVQKYEKGVNRVGASRLEIIAQVLEVPVGFFFGSNGKQQEVESLLFLDSKFSLRLLRAWSNIKSEAVRRAFVGLTERIAGIEVGAE